MSVIQESAKAVSTGTGRMLIKLIDPGLGSSGYYAPEVLEAAARDKVFPAGTQMHIDHDPSDQSAAKPEGSLRNLAAVLTEDARVEPTSGALVAEAKVFSQWREFLTEAKDYIGASISAAADFTIDGQGQRIVEALLPSPLNRVDFVTIAGRGGGIMQVLEAARRVAHQGPVKEAFTQDKGEILNRAVRSLAGYAWMADYDDTHVIVEVEDGLERRSYTLSGTTATIADDAIPVVRLVTYQPVAEEPQSGSEATEALQSEEDTMAKIEIEESELEQLRAQASKAAELEQAEAERVAAEETAAQEARVSTAKTILQEAYGEQEIPAFVSRAAESAAVDQGFDAEAFRTEVQESLAVAAVAAGAGKPAGLGEPPARVTESHREVTDEAIVAALNGK